MMAEIKENNTVDVVILDDEPGIVSELIDILKDEDITSIGFNHPEEALNYLQNQTDTSVLLTDIRMPGMSGLELVKTIRDNNKELDDLNCIIMTGHGEKEDAVEALKLGFQDFLLKPLDVDHLINTINQNIEKHKLNHTKKGLSLVINNPENTAMNAVNNTAITNVIKEGLSSAILPHIAKLQTINLDKDQENIKETIDDLIKTIKTFNSAQPLKLTKEEFTAEEIIEETSELLLKKNKDLNRVNFENNTQTDIDIDIELFSESLVALIDNALRFTVPDGQCWVNFDENQEGYWIVTIEDDGDNIQNQYKESLIAPFQQEENTVNQYHNGVGIGLSWANQIINAHNGHLKLNDSEKGGLKVDIYLNKKG